GEGKRGGAVWAEHELSLGRLAEDAHVGDAAVRHEVAAAGRVAAILGPLRLAPLRLLDLAAHRGDQDVAPETHTRVLQRAHRLDVAPERALHVRDAEPEQPPVLDERARLEAAHVLQPGLAPRVRGVHVAVEHQRRPAAGSGPGPEHVRAALLDLLPLHLQAHAGERLGHQLAHGLLAAREARRADRARGPVNEALLVDLNAHRLKCGITCSPKRRICSWRFAPQSSSMMCEQPASQYSSMAAMQSAGVPAIGLQRSSSESVTCAFAARRPPRSIASATGWSSSIRISARSSSVSAEPLMFWNLLARYMPAISRPPARPAT